MSKKLLIVGTVLFVIALILMGVSRYYLKNIAPRNDHYQFRQFVAGVTMPTSMAYAGDTLYITERPGLIRAIHHGQLSEQPFMDLRSEVISEGIEQGLLSMVMSPDAQHFYVYYTAKPDGRTVIERYSLSTPTQADRESAELVFQIPQTTGRHHGGDMHFGADGYLYFSLGDGGISSNGPDITEPKGAILRIDVSELPYRIPPDNPLVDVPGAVPEIWVYGLRNPWRFAFHEEDLYIADVGEDSYEEINFQPANSTGGENYGWNLFEGEMGDSSKDGLTFPIAIVERGESNCSITGGYVYRGAIKDLQGRYFFGDWCSGQTWTLAREADGWAMQPFISTRMNINSFGVDASGELYILTTSMVLKLVER